MTIKEIKDKKLILLECISGSRAYNLHHEKSDTDIKGVFILPKTDFYTRNYIPQISNKTNDIVYYELGRYIELLSVNNPNILEMLFTPYESILYKNPILDSISPDLILSKLCEKTFGNYALAQIKKAKGLNKKIVNPMPQERKSVLDFCYVTNDMGSISLRSFLESKKWKQKNCGLVNIPHIKDMYSLYYNELLDYKGIIQGDKSNTISLSSIPKGEKKVCLLYFNADGYSSYCKDYREYWEWVELRNEDRFENTKNHTKNYDSKNMMHTFRLLEMAIEIAQEKRIHVQRKDREILLKIKSGVFEYEELIEMAKKKQTQMKEAFNYTDLIDNPDITKLNQLHYEIRNSFYNP